MRTAKIITLKVKEHVKTKINSDKCSVIDFKLKRTLTDSIKLSPKLKVNGRF